jgi:CBS domain-containing protein
MHVRDVLMAKGNRVISIEADATVSEAIARLVQNNIGSLPVVDSQGKLLGMLSERDVLRGLHNHGEGFGRTRVVDAMTCHPESCELEADVNDVMGQMSQRRIAKVPVLDGTKVIGIVSVGDVIKVMYEKVKSENDHLMTYIHGTH